MEHEFRFNPELELTHIQRSTLAATCATEGYRVIHLILRSIVDQYMIALQNVPVQNPDEVLAKHQVSKTATQIYTAMTERINGEIVEYMANMPSQERPNDPTETLLDIGPQASTFDDIINESLEEDFINE